MESLDPRGDQIVIDEICETIAAECLRKLALRGCVAIVLIVDGDRQRCISTITQIPALITTLENEVEFLKNGPKQQAH